MVSIDAGIGDGHQAAKPGPAARIGGAESGGGKRCPTAAIMIFGCLVMGRIQNSARGRYATFVFRPRLIVQTTRHIAIGAASIVYPVAAIDKHHKSGCRKSATSPAATGGKGQEQTGENRADTQQAEAGTGMRGRGGR